MKVRIYQTRKALRLLGERDEERLLGEIAHLALYFLERYTGDSEEIRKAVDRALALYAEPLVARERLRGELIHILEKALEHPKIRALFASNFPDLREHPLVTMGKEGLESHRPDRLLFLPEGLLVIDYKLSGPREEHVRQVQTYLQELVHIWPGTLKGLLVYLRPPEVREVAP